MLIYIEHGDRLTAWNKSVSEVDAQPYLSDNCLWVDNVTFPPIEDRKGFNAFYRYVDGEIVVGYEEIIKTDEELQSEMLLETAINVEYLVCLADLGL